MSDNVTLIDLAATFPDLPIDLKYATADNLTGRAIYRESRCLLHPDAVKAAGGFRGIASEWWHFELPNAGDYPLLADQFGCFSYD